MLSCSPSNDLRRKMKKIAVGLIAVFGLVLLQPAQAEEKKSIVIIDTAVDTSLPELQGKIVYEVCLMEELRCPNKKSFMEGPGSATLPVPQVYSGGFAHGTQMSLVATRTNPNINIVFIRIFPMDKNGNVVHSAANSNSTVKQALDWVVKNKTKFNVVSVSVSLGQRPLKTGANYCSINRFDSGLKSSIESLKNLGVASVFATGNDRDKSRINYPACLADAIAVASIGPRGNTESYNNDSAELDFYALGRHELATENVSGTSAATAAFAAYWAKSYTNNYQMTYDYLKSIATTSDTNKNNTVIDVLK
jgi:hypothetical protein